MLTLFFVPTFAISRSFRCIMIIKCGGFVQHNVELGTGPFLSNFDWQHDNKRYPLLFNSHLFNGPFPGLPR